MPNALFLSAPLTNERFTGAYVLHTILVPLKADDDWRSAEQRLLAAAQDACRPFLDSARSHLAQIGQQQGLEPPSVDPRISIQLPEPGRLNLLLRIPAPAGRKQKIEQTILRAYLHSNSRPPAADASGG